MVATAVADASPLGRRGSPRSQSERRVYAVVPRVDGLHGGGQGRRRSNGGVGDGDGAPWTAAWGPDDQQWSWPQRILHARFHGRRVVGVSDV